MSELTPEYLREILHYEPETGVFRWKISPSNSVKVGCEAGRKCNHYIQIRICNKVYYAHRLAWFYTHGHWPNGMIDHINLIKNDNRISNLRDVTAAVNSQNNLPRKENPGTYYDARHNKWNARIAANGKRVSLGYFPSAELALEAYLEAKAKLHSV